METSDRSGIVIKIQKNNTRNFTPVTLSKFETEGSQIQI